MKLQKLIIYALSCATLPCISLTSFASELPISSFYSCDLDTREVVNYDIEVPEDEVDELSMAGSFGTVDDGISDMENMDVSHKKTEYGWFSDENGTYYRQKNGKLCTKDWKKIGKYYYSFDSEGRMQTGKVRLSNGWVGYFKPVNGRFAYYIKNLTVIKKAKTSLIASDGQNSYYISTKNVTVVNKAGKKIKASKLKKNSEIRVMFKGNLLESDPMSFQKIVRIKKL